jgi:hypothetical protein
MAVLPPDSNLTGYGGGAVTILGTNATATISATSFKQNSASFGAAILIDLGAIVLLQKVSTPLVHANRLYCNSAVLANAL